MPPETLLKATVLMALYSIRSERAFCERLNYDLLFKWFLDLPIDAKAFDATTFTKNRDRLLDHEIADRFFAAVVGQAKLRRYVSSDHFSVDGTLLEAWASHKSFQPKDTPGTQTSRPRAATPRSASMGNAARTTTHQSTTDPEARMARKSNATAAKLCYTGHLLMEHRNALLVDAELTEATGYAERDTALEMLDRLPTHEPATHGRGLTRATTPQTSSPMSASSGSRPTSRRTRRNRASRSMGGPPAMAAIRSSQRIRKRIEEPFGWIKTIAGGRKLRYIGRATEPGLVPHDRRRLQHHPNRRPRHRDHLSVCRPPPPRAKRSHKARRPPTTRGTPANEHRGPFIADTTPPQGRPPSVLRPQEAEIPHPAKACVLRESSPIAGVRWPQGTVLRCAGSRVHAMGSAS